MIDVLIIILMIVVAIAVMFVVPPWLMKRAIPQVIRIFIQHDAIGINNAKTVEELGLRRRGVFEQMFRRRDYKQYALNALMKIGIIQMTEDEKLYLSEEKLRESGLGKSVGFPLKKAQI